MRPLVPICPRHCSSLSALTEDLQGIVRTGMPNGYELDYTWFHPAFAEEFLPPPADPDPIAARPNVAGVNHVEVARSDRQGIASNVAVAVTSS